MSSTRQYGEIQCSGSSERKQSVLAGLIRHDRGEIAGDSALKDD